VYLIRLGVDETLVDPSERQREVREERLTNCVNRGDLQYNTIAAWSIHSHQRIHNQCDERYATLAP